MYRIFLITSLCLSFAGLSQAAVEPVTLGKDARVQFLNYDVNEVYEINTQIGKTTLIQLEKGEQISGDTAGLVMGDSEAWKVQVQGNNIFFKPAAELPDTNMIVVTNKRTYAFSLKTQQFSTTPSYIVRFVYPPEGQAGQPTPNKIDEKKQKTFNDALLAHNGNVEEAMNDLGTLDLNVSFFVAGDNEIRPTGIWSDNNFTYLQYKNNREMPVVFKLDNEGNESNVNTHVVDDMLVIHDVSEMHMLRLGNKVMKIYNATAGQDKPFNHAGASNAGEYRYELGEAD